MNPPPSLSGRMLHHLPVEAYTSQEWFDREQAAIFSATWRYAGFAEDIAEPGQYIAVQAGLNNLFAKPKRRSPAPTTTGPTISKAAWSRSRRNRASSARSINPASDSSRPQSTCGAACSGSTPIRTRVRSWTGSARSNPSSARTRSNWKIVVENYIDVYHLAHLHAGTLSMYDHAKAEFGFVGPHYAFREPLSADYAADLERNAPTPLILPVSEAAAYVPMLFPGIGLAESEADWSTFIITPLAPDRTRVENRVRVKNVSAWEFQKQAWRSGPFWRDRVKGKYAAKSGDHDDPMTSGDFSAEDIYACEQQQKSLSSPYFEVGPAAKGESPVLEHQRIVLDFLERFEAQG